MLARLLLISLCICTVHSFNLEQPEQDEGLTPICQISRCFCDLVTRTVLCRHVIFPNLPRFPIWTETLKLASNHLTLLKSKSFDGLHRLQKLYLSDNDLEAIEPAAFDGLTELTFLDLSYNRIRNVPSAMFKYLPRLSILNVSGNIFDDLSLFDSIPPEMRLMKFVMRNVAFECCPQASHARFPQSEKLVLTGTKFHSFTEDGLVMSFGANAKKSQSVTIGSGSLTSALELDVSDCGAVVEPGFFDIIGSVRSLKIGGNAIEDDILETLAKLNDFPKLEVLNVSGLSSRGTKQPLVNKWNIFPVPLKFLDISSLGIRNISFDLVAKAGSELAVLKASNNFLYALHLSSKLSRLERLDLANNQLVFFPSYDEGVQFSHLEVLDLTDNLIAHVDGRALQGYPNLKVLRLAKNRIAMVETKAFSSTCCSVLEVLELSDNALEHVPRITTPALKRLDLSSNRLVTIERGGVLASAKRLEVLNISDNHDLMAFLGKVMVNCTNEENCLSLTWVGELASLPVLRRFLAARVGFSHFPTSPFNKVLSRVQEIDLSGNAITSDDWENAVSSMPSKPCVRSMRLAGNKFTRLRNMTLFRNDCLEILDLISNPFVCDCHTETLVSILKALPPSSEVPQYNDSRYFCFSSAGGAYRRAQFHELGMPNGLRLACSIQETRSKKVAAEATAIGFYAILGVLLGSATFVIVAICCRACLLAANQYVRSVRQRVYEPLRVIITSDLASPAGTPAML